MESNEKIRIGGIKFSGSLAMMTFTYPDDSSTEPDAGAVFFKLLTDNRINMPFVTRVIKDGDICITCCISSKDSRIMQRLITQTPVFQDRTEMTADTGTISIFPHQSRIGVLARALHAFGNAGIPVFGMTSSISALTFITECRQLNAAAEALKSYFDLPENHMPFQAEFCIKQIEP